MKTLETEVGARTFQGVKFLNLNWLRSLLVASALLLIHAHSFGQNIPQTGNRSQDIVDNSLINHIASYDENLRNHILVVAQYPDILRQAAEIREQTTRAFQNTIGKYAQKKQNWFYELSRYPDLMSQLAALPGRAGKDEVSRLLPDNSNDQLKQGAWMIFRHHHDDLIAVASMQDHAASSFIELVRNLGPTARNAFYSVEKMPDVLSLLNDNLEATTRLGIRYESDALKVSDELAQVHDQISGQAQQDLGYYRDELATDPQAMEELRKASQDYASTGGYSYPAPTEDKVVNYGSPYSYWLGYPSWYGYPAWYPGAFGFGGGIYLGLGGYPAIYGLPSVGFSNWFFGGAYRYYPHLYRRYGVIYQNAVGRSRLIAPSGSSFLSQAGSRFRTSSINGRVLSGDRGLNNQAMRRAGAYSQPNARQYSGSYSRPSYNFPSRSYGGTGRSNGMSGGFHGGFRGGRR